ncbi:MAG TPA: AMP-binding protein, partial [Actinomycetota bacterium]|nr:AMP-binding protein [Actinomycetota bacterium]
MPNQAAATGALPEIFQEAARLGGTLSILGDSTEETRSHREVADLAALRAGGLADKGIGRGDRVCLFARTSFDFVADLLAVWHVGAVAVPLPIPPRFLATDNWMDQAEAQIRNSRAACMLLAGDDPEPPSTKVVRAEDLEATGTYDGPGPTAEDVALIQWSSGSTSRPKGVILTHRAIAAHLELNREHVLHFGPGPVFSWLPLYHDAGLLVYLLTPLSGGATLTMLRTDSFLARPLRWLEEMDRTRAHVCCAPTFGYALAARALEGTEDTLDLSSWKQAYIGAEPIDVRTVKRFLRAAEPHGFDARAMLPGYGLAEATCTVTVGVPMQGIRIDTIDRSALAMGEAKPASRDTPGAADVVSVGVPAGDMEVIVVDTGDHELPDRGVGEVLVRGSSLMEGYLKDAEATRAALANGWLHTGDRGYLADGELFITGRIKDVIVVRGRNHHAEDLEQIVLALPDVRPGACVCIGIDDEGS